MNKFITLCGMLLSSIAFSQSYVGFLNDNYSGVNAVINNPANIVDSRYRADINLFSASGSVANDFLGVNFNDYISGESEDFKHHNSNSINGNANVDILGPSFMFNLKPKHSIAVFSRFRSMASVNEFNGEAYSVVVDDFIDTEDKKLTLGSFNVNTHSWGELGLTYATVLIDKKKHFLKGGLTLKYLTGMLTARVSGDNMVLDYNSTTQSAITSGNFSFGYSDDPGANSIEDLLEVEAKGFGTDIGFTYEWRPEIDKYSYSNNEGREMYHRDVNKYKVKFGLSVTDIGSINYEKAREEAYNIDGDILNEANLDAASSLNGTSKQLTYLFGAPSITPNNLKSSLPTAIHFNADWNINQKLYLNLDTNFDVANKKTSTNIQNTYSLTPRIEMKWLSAYLPLSYYEHSGLNAGFGLRLGPLYAGSGSIITNLLSDESKGADVYLGLKIPIYQSKPKDRDGDGVFDKVDKCPKGSGPKENNGCPWGDKDEDGVKDNVDKCTDVKGPKENNGCPWGDKDKDGVKDNVDTCPDVAGLEKFKGCPDTDGDGIQDSEDKCPKVKGDKEYKGCPADSDGDGIIDIEDKCPKVAGVVKNNGCPEKEIIITEEAKKTIDSYAKSIYFNSAKTTFRVGVAEKLDMIVDVMNEYSSAKFSIEGHTDSQGKASLNKSLSKRRAKAVEKYLVKKGISPSRLSSVGFGEEYPIDTNKTRNGRANNRRVEIKLKK